MKNKIKKIIPLILCFVLVAGSCLTVNAAKVSSKKYLEGDSFVMLYETDNLNNGDYRGYEITFTLSSVEEEVRVVPLAFNNSSTSSHVGYVMVSKKPFKYSSFENQWYNRRDDYLKDYNDVLTNSLGPYSASSLSYNGTKYYYASYAFGLQPANLSPSFGFSYINMSDYVSGYFKTDSVKGEFFEKMYLADFTWDDGKASVYDTQPTAEIEPPKNLSIYRGYSNADKQYKFQMQWDKPADTDLNVEVMYNIHWKEGTGSALGFGTHVYKKYQHLLYDDGHSAQTNKLQYLEDDLLKGYFESQNMDVPSVYNIDEIYVRFAKEIDGVIHYSLWRKIDYMNLDEGNGFDSTEDDFQAESSTGAFDTSDNWIDQSVQNGEIVNGSEKEDAKAPGLDANGDNITNVNKPIVNPDSWDGQFEGVFAQFTNAIKSAFSFVGEFPSMLSEFFGFLPASVIGCISIGLIMVVVLRFLGR